MTKFPLPFHISFFMAIILLLGCLPQANENQSSEQELEALRERIDQFNTAFKNGDVKVLESMITDNYLHTNSNSKAIRKKDWVAYLHKRKKELASGELEVNNYKMEETEIELFDDVAIVTGKISFSSKRAEEQKENVIRITNIWVKEEGLWKRAGFHDTRIK